MRNFTRRTFLKLSAILAALPLPLVLSPAKTEAFKIRMIEDASIWDYGTADGVNRMFAEYQAGSIYDVPVDIDRDWADSMILTDLAERVLT